jgi:hypothetical protein
MIGRVACDLGFQKTKAAPSCDDAAYKEGLEAETYFRLFIST